MDAEQFDTLCAIFLSQTEAINRLATAVEALVKNQNQPEKKEDVSHIRKLADYPSINWSSIGAEILHCDKDGVTAVSWKGKQYTRRHKSKYGQELWFSCCIGKNENGENLYHRLICFKDAKAIEVEAVPDSIRQLIPAPEVITPPPPQISLTREQNREEEELVYWQQQVRELVKQLNWSEEQAKAWSKRNFGKISTLQMTIEELKKAFKLLQSLVNITAN